VVVSAQPTFIVSKKGGAVMHITTLGIDAAKNVFQLYGVDARGLAVLSRRVKRSQLVDTVSLPPCVIGMEACGSAQVGEGKAGAHHTPSLSDSWLHLVADLRQSCSILPRSASVSA